MFGRRAQGYPQGVLRQVRMWDYLHALFTNPQKVYYLHISP
jgi:hypothetical protein